METAELTVKLAKDLKGESEVENSSIVGTLTAASCTARVFRSCRFRGRVDLRGLTADGALEFEDCVFENGIDLTGATIRGRLAFRGCTVVAGGRDEPIDGVKAFSLADCKAASLQIEKLEAEPRLDATRLRLDGPLDLNVIRVERLDVSGLSADSFMGRDLDARLGIDLRNSVVNQSIRITGCNSGKGGIDLHGTIVKNNFVHLKNIHIAGDLDAHHLRVGTMFGIESFEEPCEIGGRINLERSDISQLLLISNIIVRENIDAQSLSAGGVLILGSPTDPLTSAIGGQIKLSDTKIRHDVKLWGLTLGTAYQRASGSGHSLIMRNAEIGGNVTLNNLPEDEESVDSPHAEWYSISCDRGVDFSYSRIGANADLSLVRCDRGPILLNDAKIGHNLRVCRHDKKAQAQWLQMNSLDCRGEVDLTGLTLAKADGKDPCVGHLDARFANIAKGLHVAADGHKDKAGVWKGGDFAEIPGHLDLTGCNLKELTVSVDSFLGDSLSSGDNLKLRGIILAQAQIGKLTAILGPELGGKSKEKRYPRPIDLSHSDINWWVFSTNGTTDSDNAEDYLQMLEGDTIRQRHTYRSIEQNLINRGHEDAADMIHREMAKWASGDRDKRASEEDRTDRKEGRKRVPRLKRSRKRIWNWVCRKFSWWTDWGTTPWRLFWLVAFWVVVSSLLFSIQKNIAPSASGLSSKKGVLFAYQPPTEEQWHGMSGFWMALRYHLPVAVLATREDWQPSDSRLRIWTNRELPLPVNAEDYANFVLALHWIIWPILLYQFSRKIFRRSEK
jgi:hypothetical protein